MARAEIQKTVSSLNLHSIQSPDLQSKSIQIEGLNLQMVVIKSPYDSIENPLTQEVFMKISALKIKGYQKEYPYGVLPVDSYDYIATHLVLCETNNGKLNPLMGMKAVSLARCETHCLPFPAFHLSEHLKPDPYGEAIQKIIDSAKQKHEEVGYNGSWTIHPKIRENKVLARTFRDITTGFFVWHYGSLNTRHLFTGATLRFKMDHYTDFLGFKDIELDGSVLPSFDCQPFFGEKVSLRYLQEFTHEAKSIAAQYEEFWHRALILDRSIEESDSMQIAA